jgi:hypothetical protein
MKRIMMILPVFFLFISFIVQGGTASANSGQEQNAIAAEAQKGGYRLISPDEIKAEYLKDPGSLFRVDTRQEWAYLMQHTQGAAYLSVTPTWWYPYYPGSRSDMKKVLGPDKDKRVTFY